MTAADSELEELLREQVLYYRARAPEYDEWLLREGRHDAGADRNRAWQAELEKLTEAIAAFAPRGKVLELACGTGFWTARLAAAAASVTAVDASPEVIALNGARCNADNVEYLIADLFSWRPAERYDVVFFAFWLSHVPVARFSNFWSTVEACLAPRGRVFFIDNLLPGPGAASTRVLLGRDYTADDLKAQTTLRVLNDGRKFRAVKVWHEPADLEQRLGNLGWNVHVQTTGRFFYWGECRRHA